MRESRASKISRVAAARTGLVVFGSLGALGAAAAIGFGSVAKAHDEGTVPEGRPAPQGQDDGSTTLSHGGSLVGPGAGSGSDATSSGS